MLTLSDAVRLARSGDAAFFFFNDTATTEIYTLSLHDALPISRPLRGRPSPPRECCRRPSGRRTRDRKSTRLNSSHSQMSYAVFCLKKKKKGSEKVVSINNAMINALFEKILRSGSSSFFFFFNDTAPPEIYTLSLHDALPISALAATAAPPTPIPIAVPSTSARFSD